VFLAADNEKMSGQKSKNGVVVIISGPSGVGKSTICKEVVKRLSDVYLSVSVTTRPKAASEVDGEDYWFISEEEFQKRIDEELPSHKELAQRLSRRGREDAEATEERLDEADAEIAAAWQYYQHMVINEDLDQAVNEVIHIIKQARSGSVIEK
jgi:guanylate kinase